VRQLRAIIMKEFIHIRRDPMLLVFTLAFPLLLLLLFGYALRLRIENLTAAVWDQDRTFLSLQVKDRLVRDSRLIVVDVDSEDAIRTLLQTGRARLGLVIPSGFSRRVADGKQSTFPLFIDGTMPTVAQAAMLGVSVLTDEDASDIFAVDDSDHPPPPVRQPPIKIDTTVLFNPTLRDSDFFLPGTIGIVIMVVTLTLATGLVREKEQQTIEQLLATPLTGFAIIAGKMIPYAIIAGFEFVLVAGLGWAVFALPIRGSMSAFAVLAALFVLALLALGSLIATISKNQLQANFLSVFIIVPSILLSGFVFPLEAMPRWLQPVAWCLPMTYFVDAVRGLTLKGTSIRDQMREFVVLAGFLVGFVGLSVALFRKQLG
jgi:ABC-2 type transport system permease protein